MTFECCWLFEFMKGVYVFSPIANYSWQVSSLSETKAHQVMQQKATSFINFNQQQLSRIYPSSYRVDSSNFNPQPFWNAGCQLGMSSTATQQVYHSYCNNNNKNELLWFQLHSTTSQRAGFSNSTEPNFTAMATVATSSNLTACVKVSTEKIILSI